MYPISVDFSALRHSNFIQLNSLPNFDIDYLDENNGWYLLCLLRERERNGHSFEITFAVLNAFIDTSVDNSHFRSRIDNKISFLNQNHHLTGESASNKSAICQEISLALQKVNELFPGRYSASKQDSDKDSENSTNNVKNKSNINNYSTIVSNTTEVGLLNNLSKIDTMLLHSDGDVAINKLGYYDQRRNETSAGISLFCDASDGLFKGFTCGTGVSQVTINRPVASFNTFIASTGTKRLICCKDFTKLKNKIGTFESLSASLESPELDGIP